jgi:hypothetical protein
VEAAMLVEAGCDSRHYRIFPDAIDPADCDSLQNPTGLGVDNGERWLRVYVLWSIVPPFGTERG